MNERERIEYLMNIYMLTPSQFADKTGIQRASVSHILSSRNKPSLEILHKIYKAFPDVDVAWLMLGEGEPPVLQAVDGCGEHQNQPEVAVEQQQVVAATLFPSLMETEVVPASPPMKKTLEKNVNAHTSSQDNNVTETQLQPASDVKTSDCGEKKELALTEISLKKDSCKRVKEIKIFYDNGTYETFVPEKK